MGGIVVNKQLTMNYPLTLATLGLMAAYCLAGPAPTNSNTLVKPMNGEESCPGPICQGGGCCPVAGWYCCPGGEHCAATPSNCPNTKLNYVSTRNVVKNIPAKGDLHQAESTPIKSKDLFKSTNKDGSCPGKICPGGRCCPHVGWYCCPGGEYCAVTPSNCPDCAGPICHDLCCPYEGWICCPNPEWCAVTPSHCP